MVLKMKAWMILMDVSTVNYVFIIMGNWGKSFNDLIWLLWKFWINKICKMTKNNIGVF